MLDFNICLAFYDLILSYRILSLKKFCATLRSLDHKGVTQHSRTWQELVCTPTIPKTTTSTVTHEHHSYHTQASKSIYTFITTTNLNREGSSLSSTKNIAYFVSSKHSKGTTWSVLQPDTPTLLTSPISQGNLDLSGRHAEVCSHYSYTPSVILIYRILIALQIFAETIE